MMKNKMMQKNKMVRLASGLLVLTMATTCIISGTFAKYVTGDEAGDSAHVAKWGVTTTISGALFGAHYNAFSEDDLESGQISAAYTGSVDSHAEIVGETDGEKNIVAPGTKSDNMTISIAGRPEVSGKIEVKVDGNLGESKDFSDIWLQEGTYGVMTDVTDTVKTEDDIVGLYTYDSASGKYTKVAFGTTYSKDDNKNYYKYSDEVMVSANTYELDITDTIEADGPRFIGGKYYPIVWNLSNKKSGADFEDIELNLNSVNELKSAIEGNIIDAYGSFDSHTDLGEQVGVTTINWKWAFETIKDDGLVSSVVDGCDTILSKLMAWDETSNYQVVKVDGNGYTGVTKTTTTNGVTYAVAGGAQLACLTVGFNIKVTVSQAD